MAIPPLPDKDSRSFHAKPTSHRIFQTIPLKKQAVSLNSKEPKHTNTRIPPEKLTQPVKRWLGAQQSQVQSARMTIARNPNPICMVEDGGSRKFQAGLPKSRASTHCLKSSYTLMQDYNHWP
jgi:hypothetical protein